jgi:hypothetical protein
MPEPNNSEKGRKISRDARVWDFSTNGKLNELFIKSTASVHIPCISLISADCYATKEAGLIGLASAARWQADILLHFPVHVDDDCAA